MRFHFMALLAAGVHSASQSSPEAKAKELRRTLPASCDEKVDTIDHLRRIIYGSKMHDVRTNLADCIKRKAQDIIRGAQDQIRSAQDQIRGAQGQAQRQLDDTLSRAEEFYNKNTSLDAPLLSQDPGNPKELTMEMRKNLAMALYVYSDNENGLYNLMNTLGREKSTYLSQQGTKSQFGQFDRFSKLAGILYSAIDWLEQLGDQKQISTYRGMNVTPWRQYFNIGTYIRQARGQFGFMSTSLDQEIAEEYMYGAENQRCRLFTTFESSKGAPMEQYARFTEEREKLMKPGTHFQLTKYEIRAWDAQAPKGSQVSPHVPLDDRAPIVCLTFTDAPDANPESLALTDDCMTELADRFGLVQADKKTLQNKILERIEAEVDEAWNSMRRRLVLGESRTDQKFDGKGWHLQQRWNIADGANAQSGKWSA